MSASGLSKPRLARMQDVMFAHVARGELPGLVTPAGGATCVSTRSV
jgi:hypothetical protein